MNNQARTCELKCKYNIQGICHAYGECIAKDLFIAELEKIKADVINIADGRQSIKVKSVRNIIDKHISELKGENKA